MRGVLARRTKVRNPLEPLATINGMVLSLLVLGFAAAAIGALFGKATFLGWGQSGDICTTSKDVGTQIQPSPWMPLRTGVTVSPDTIQLCAHNATTVQRWWYSLSQLPGAVTLLTLVLLTYLVLRQAERFGLYSPGIGTRMRVLGWFLSVESILGPTITVYANRKLWATMTDGPSEIQWVPGWVALFAGLALLSLARIMRVGSAMREDLEGVV
ncbi:hypothetical protein KGQ20_05595 [Catenulispora sp. NF23]|uniref:DUF2975 domain-containing protein n=1 Tax=Catenulispora pinistramenti TaxID=2705254 RepID=A0ABS5KJ54_9ACTN|nr:hypothetical protein [Catenulispora pinistramenti]MBS2532240.1 hypothetical protein [Catenulispora pinistramenti]MBS2546359.1 hypothetical protein [Catenulispora pinistramenti]